MQGLTKNNYGYTMEIRTIGNGRRLSVCAELLSGFGNSRYPRIILLPIPTTFRDGYIGGTGVSLEELLSLSDSGTLAVGYNIPLSLGRELSARGATLFDLGRDEKFLLGNAELTALGALGYILTECDSAPEELYIGLVGYGRIGRALLRLLLFLGARVRVYTTRESVRLGLCEMGVESRLVSEEKDLSELSLLINTAPSEQLSVEDLSPLPEDYRIIELASGENFGGDRRVIRLPAIPERRYPISAGRLMYKRICEEHLGGSGGGEL